MAPSSDGHLARGQRRVKNLLSGTRVGKTDFKMHLLSVARGLVFNLHHTVLCIPCSNPAFVFGVWEVKKRERKKHKTQTQHTRRARPSDYLAAPVCLPVPVCAAQMPDNDLFVSCICSLFASGGEYQERSDRGE